MPGATFTPSAVVGQASTWASVGDQDCGSKPRRPPCRRAGSAKTAPVGDMAATSARTTGQPVFSRAKQQPGLVEVDADRGA